jgi:hypothetical protein
MFRHGTYTTRFGARFNLPVRFFCAPPLRDKVPHRSAAREATVCCVRVCPAYDAH